MHFDTVLVSQPLLLIDHTNSSSLNSKYILLQISILICHNLLISINGQRRYRFDSVHYITPPLNV